MEINITVDAKAVLKGLSDLERVQLPYATSRALNQLANDVQADIVAGIMDRFTVRRPAFVRRSIYIAPADRARKDKLSVTVRTNPDRGDILGQHETKHDKRPTRGAHITVPIDARRAPRSIVPANQRPRALGDRAFTLPLKNGHEGLFMRMQRRVRRRQGAPPLPSGRDPRLKLLYVLTPRVPLPGRLHFLVTARSTALARWPQRMREALADAIRTAFGR